MLLLSDRKRFNKAFRPTWDQKTLHLNQTIELFVGWLAQFCSKNTITMDIFQLAFNIHHLFSSFYFRDLPHKIFIFQQLLEPVDLYWKQVEVISYTDF